MGHKAVASLPPCASSFESRGIGQHMRHAMRKKTSGRDSTEKGKARRKLSDLEPKKVKGGDAASIKGGPIYHKIT